MFYYQKIFIYSIILFLAFLNNLVFPQKKETKVSGIVFENKTNEKLVGVLIAVSDSGVAVTDEKGFFHSFFHMVIIIYQQKLLVIKKKIKV